MCTSKEKIEFMTIKIVRKKFNIIICVVYRPHSTNVDDFSERESSIVNLIETDTILFICGDFNINTIYYVTLM